LAAVLAVGAKDGIGGHGLASGGSSRLRTNE